MPQGSGRQRCRVRPVKRFTEVQSMLGDRDRRSPEQSRLPGGSDCAGDINVGSQISAIVDTGQHQIKFGFELCFELRQRDPHAVRWRPVDRPGLRRALLQIQRPIERDLMADSRLLGFRRDDRTVSKLTGHVGKRRNPGSVPTIVVGDQNLHVVDCVEAREELADFESGRRFRSGAVQLNFPSPRQVVQIPVSTLFQSVIDRNRRFPVQ